MKQRNSLRRPSYRLALFLAGVVLVASILAFALTAPAGALPEYSVQTGEPCATCHLSPSGGGLRTPRGQAWVADHRPGTVPAIEDALALLGVHLTVRKADFVAPADALRPPAKPVLAPHAAQDLREWVAGYEGN